MRINGFCCFALMEVSRGAGGRIVRKVCGFDFLSERGEIYI